MTFVMNIPYGGIMVALNESMKKVRFTCSGILLIILKKLAVCMYVCMGIRY